MCQLEVGQLLFWPEIIRLEGTAAAACDELVKIANNLHLTQPAIISPREIVQRIYAIIIFLFVLTGR